MGGRVVRDRTTGDPGHGHSASGEKGSIRTPDGLVDGPLILIAPDAPHSIEPLGRIALLFVEPEGRAGRSLRELLGGAPVTRLAPVPGLGETLARIWRTPRPTDAEIAAIGCSCSSSWADPRSTRPAIAGSPACWSSSGGRRPSPA